MAKAVFRMLRVLGLALVIWPFLGTGGEANKARSSTVWQFPEVGRCQASSLPGATTQGDGLSYDANGARCVYGGAGCDLHYY